jgi:hypothetical protein
MNIVSDLVGLGDAGRGLVLNRRQALSEAAAALSAPLPAAAGSK